MKKYLLQALLLAVAVTSIASIEWYRTTHIPYIEAQTIGVGVTSFDQLEKRFASLAESKGAVYAFDVLRIAQLPPNTDLHLLGHTIGDILYKQKGVQGIEDCTQEFRNACSHTIVIGTLDEYGGQAALPLIDDSCKKAPGGPGAYTMCYHGLGHGVFAYFGYDLAKTAAFCKKMGTAAYHDQQYIECVGGSIMELMGGGGHDHEKWLVAQKKYLTDDPLSPCMDAVIPDEAKSICFIYLTPELFLRAGANLGNPDPNTFPKAFSYCDAIPSSRQLLRDACFGGFGKEFVPLAGSRDIRNVTLFTDQQYQEAISWCHMAGVHDGEVSCIKEALASVFWGGENDPQASFRFCALVGANIQSSCYRNLGNNIVMYTNKKQRDDLCAQLLSVSKESCDKRQVYPS